MVEKVVTVRMDETEAAMFKEIKKISRREKKEGELMKQFMRYYYALALPQIKDEYEDYRLGLYNSKTKEFQRFMPI